VAKETNARQPPGNAAEDKFFGRMNDPAAAASIKGLCGDEMEFHLVIRDGRIEDIRYYTNGCGNTRWCGRAVARRAKSRSITDALSISAGELIHAVECEPESGRHGAIPAVTTPCRVIADYLLTP
jgi:nitrogen fixation NifU-like protein